MASGSVITTPQTVPITVKQYRLLVEHDTFADRRGQVELIFGKIVETHQQGPQDADPIDELGQWSHQAVNNFRIRIEKPIEIPDLNSSPEPDVVWATKRRYSDRHPLPEEIHLLIEVSGTSKQFDRGEKRRLYAEAGISEYWIVDIASRRAEVLTQPDGTEFKQAKTHGVDDSIAPTCLPSAVLPVARLFSDATG